MNVDNIVTSTVAISDSDRTKMYPKANTETTTSDSILNKSTKEITERNLPNNTDKNTTIKTILNKKNGNITVNNDHNKSDKTKNNETYQNNKNNSVTIDSAQNDNESKPITRETTHYYYSGHQWQF